MAQMEGGIIFGLTAALKTEITFKNGRVEQTNFNDYPMLRIFESPEIEVHIVPSTENPTGVGEPGVPPVAPALVNAIFAVTGKRIRRLPIRAADLAGNGERSHGTMAQRIWNGRRKLARRFRPRPWRAACARPSLIALRRLCERATRPVASRSLRADAKPDAAASRAAFLQVYRVLTSPRCQNCHPAGDAPLQGDDSHVHIQNVKRGRTATACMACAAILATRRRILPARICRRKSEVVLPKPEHENGFCGASRRRNCAGRSRTESKMAGDRLSDDGSHRE